MLFCSSGTLFLTAMTVDRYMAVCHPFKAQMMNTPKRARIIIACILCGTTIYTIPYFFTSKWFPESRLCISIARQDTLSQSYGWVTLTLTSFTPFLVLLTLNTLIIRAVKQSRQQQKQMTNASTKEPREKSTKRQSSKDGVSGESMESREKTARRNRENQLVTMLLLATFMFLVLTLPYVLRNATASLWNYEGNPELYAGYTLVVQLSAMLYFTNNAVNFYLYCLVGKKFRKDVKSLFCCRKSKPDDLSALETGTESTQL